MERSNTLPWLLVILLAVLCAAMWAEHGDEQRQSRGELAKARDEAAEFRHSFFKEQATLEAVDREREQKDALAKTLQERVAAHSAADAEQQRLMEALSKKLSEAEGDVERDANQVVTVNLHDEILFKSGEADLSPKGKEVLTRVGDVLKPLQDKQILVGGHTDDNPIHTQRFPSNWELSTARALSVVHHLVDTVGVDPDKLTAAGYSQYHPRAREKAKNRRIEILLVPVAAAKKSGG
jgi:chemotaxis protein MotB